MYTRALATSQAAMGMSNHRTTRRHGKTTQVCHGTGTHFTHVIADTTLKRDSWGGWMVVFSKWKTHGCFKAWCLFPAATQAFVPQSSILLTYFPEDLVAAAPKMTPLHVVQIGLDTMCGLYVLWRATGCVHGDVAPNNILIQRGKVDKATGQRNRPTGAIVGLDAVNHRFVHPAVRWQHTDGPPHIAFASVTRHQRFKKTRKCTAHPVDDIESLVYTMIWALLGRLSWQSLCRTRTTLPQSSSKCTRYESGHHTSSELLAQELVLQQKQEMLTCIAKQKLKTEMQAGFGMCSDIPPTFRFAILELLHLVWAHRRSRIYAKSSNRIVVLYSRVHRILLTLEADLVNSPIALRTFRRSGKKVIHSSQSFNHSNTR